MASETIIAAAGVIAILANAATGLYILVVKPGRKIKDVTDRAGDFWDDWFGTEDRPGVPGRPGVMVRLATMEAELQANHGTSLRDAVNRTERAVHRVEDTLAAHLQEHRVIARVTHRLDAEIPTDSGTDIESGGGRDGG